MKRTMEEEAEDYVVGHVEGFYDDIKKYSHLFIGKSKSYSNGGSEVFG